MTGELALESPVEPLDLREYWRVIVRGKFIILITTVLVVSGAFFWTYLQPTVYEAQLRMAVVPRSPDVLTGDSAEPTAGSKASIETELTVLGSQELRQKVAKQLGHVPDVQFTTAGTTLIDITAHGSNAQRAAADANAYVETYIAQRRDDATRALQATKANIERQIGDLEARIASDPTLPTSFVAGIKSDIFNLQTELNNTNAALADVKAGVKVI